MGTTEQLAQVISDETGLTADFIAIAPTGAPRRILQELISNDRVIGGLTATTCRSSFYASLQGRVAGYLVHR